jgi:hypothetical protein
VNFNAFSDSLVDFNDSLVNFSDLSDSLVGLVNFTDFMSFRYFSDSFVNFSDGCGCLMWLQETSCFLPCEWDHVLGREKCMSLSSSEVNYEILHYI